MISILTFFLLASINAQQNFKFNHLTVENGLSQSSINCIVQDREGFIWAGTNAGLNKYDGYNFSLFEHLPNDSTSLSNSTIKCLFEDTDGDLWVGTGYGLNKFDKKKNSFVHFFHDTQISNTISDEKILCVNQDKAGNIWIGTYKGLNKFNKKTNTFTFYQHSPNHPVSWENNSIFCITEASEGKLWLGTARGISLFDPTNGRFSRFKLHKNASDSLAPKIVVKSIVKDNEARLWVATTGDGLKLFDLTKHSFVSYSKLPNKNSISSNNLLSLYKDSFGYLWIGTQDAGLDMLDVTNNIVEHHAYDPATSYSLNNNSVVSIYEDRSKVLWIGTFLGGINKLDLLRKKIHHYQHDPFSSNTLSANYVFSIYQDKEGSVWVGNAKGIDRIDRDKGSFTFYPITNSISNSRSDNTPHCFYEDQFGNFWVGLGGGGLKKLDKSTKSFTDFYYKPDLPGCLPSNYINILLQDSKENLWIGTKNGLSKYNYKTSQFELYTPAIKDGQKFEVTGIAEDKLGRLWVCSANYGLYELDRNTKRLIPLTNNKGGMAGMVKSSSGAIWIYNAGGGLQKFDPDKKLIVSIMKPSIISKVVIKGILEDSKGNLWISTTRDGILKYNPASNAVETLTVYDGLQSNEFTKAAFKGSKGEMYFGGKMGMNVFHPDSLERNPFVPNIVINSFKVFDKERTIENTDITLPYSDNFFSFEFAALSYAWPERNLYAYKLEGFDKEWVQSGVRRYASYTNLDPGKYVFKVIGSNHDGVWNQEGTSINLIITPPIWKTPYAYITYFLLFVALLYGVRHYTISRERLNHSLKLKSQESENLKELDKLKTRFFTNISHEFRTPLTLIISPLEKIISGNVQEHQKNEYYLLMHRNAQRLLEFINQLLDLSKLEAKGMQRDSFTGDIVYYIQTVVQSFVPLMESKKLHLIYNKNVDHCWVDFDKDKVGKIVTNLLSNAFKYTQPGGTIQVTLDVSSVDGIIKNLMLEVKDNGIGIPSEKLNKIFDRFYQVDNSYTKEVEGAGVGLALTKELVEFLGGEVMVESVEGKGTCFTLLLPLIEAEPMENAIAFNSRTNSDLFSTVLTNASLSKESSVPTSTLTDSRIPLILIVEDNDDVRSYIRSIFNDQYRVVEAVNGEDGLQKAIHEIPDIIISDLMMPKMDGHRFCKEIKTDERTSHIPVILLTAKTAIESKLESLELGGDDYITKPFHEDELRLRVRNQIEQKKKLRERIGKEMILSPSEDAINSVDKKFLEKVVKSMETHLSDPDFGVETLEKEIGMSRVHLYRKLKALTNYAPSDFIRDFRIKKAAYLLEENFGNVSEVAYKVGFNNLSYFTKCFRECYGVPPSQYAKK